MKFIYILRTFQPIEGGACKKIKFQIKNLKKHGVNVLFFDYPGINKSVSLVHKNKIVDFFYTIFFLNIFMKLRREFLLNSTLRDFIKSSDADDLIYFRFPFPSFGLWRIFKKPRKCKIVLECQSMELFEYLSQGFLFYALIDFIFGGLIIKYSDAIIGVTDEITQYELKRSNCPNKKNITIGNGYQVTSVTPRDPPLFNQKELLLLCVASHTNIWHGYDRIIAGIASYSGSLSVKLHIVGNGVEIPHLKRMVEEKDLKEKIFFHGFLSGTEYDKLFNQCHIAIGSLGLHRIRLTQGSVLKSREFCARGIPFIYASSDPDFPDDFLYIQRVPADETPISIENIISFTTLIYRDLGHPQKMHDYAVENLDWANKMKRLKDFSENLIKNS